MKRFLITILATAFAAVFAIPPCFADQKSPTEQLAPLIGEKTLVVAHVNLEAVDFAQMRKLILSGVEQYVMLQRFEQESIDEILDEGNKLLDDKLPQIEAAFNGFLEETGIRDLYFVSYYDLIEEIPGFLAIPTTGMKVQHKMRLLEMLGENNMSNVTTVKNLLVIPMENGPFRGDFDAAAYFRELRPVQVPAFDEAFDGTDKALVRAAVVVPENVTGILVEAGMPILPIPQIGSLLHLLNDHTQWGRVVLDLENANIEAAIKMSSEDSAVEARETLIDLIDMNVAMMAMQMSEQEEMADFVPFVSAYLRGFFRSILPVVDGDRLVYATSGENGVAAAVGVGGVAVALLLPAVQAARESARRMQCSNNMKQLGLAMHIYHDAHKTFPPAYTVDKDGKPLHSWRVLLLPYLEQTALYQNIRLDEPWDSEHNSQFHDVMIATFQCPSNPHVTPGANCCYTAVVGKETVFTGEKGLGIMSISDGTSNTIMFAERLEPICWMDPTQEITFEKACEGINEDFEGLGSYHTGGINAAWCDGSVRFISETVELSVLKALFTRAGGEASSWF